MSKLIDIIKKPVTGEWGEEDSEGNGTPVLRTTNFTNEGHINYSNVVTRTIDGKRVRNKFLFPGDIIIEKSGGSTDQPVGRVVYFDGDPYKYVVNNFTAILRVKQTDLMFPRYFFYYLFYNYKKGITKRYQNKTTGISNIKLDRYLEDTRIIPPTPETQYKIATTLDTVSEMLAMRKQQLAELDDLIKSIFYDMFGDPVANEKGWELKQLGEIADCFIGLTYQPEDVDNDGIIVLRSSNIQNDRLDFNDVVRVGKKVKSKLIVRDEDILMCSRNGSSRLVGKVALIPKWDEEMTFGAFMTVIRSKYGFYLFNFFRSKAFRNQLLQGKTTTINQITRAMLIRTELPLPPSKLQEQFKEACVKIEQHRCIVWGTLIQTQHLFDSLMSRYFD